MRKILFVLLLPLCVNAQHPNTSRQLVALTITEIPDNIDSNKYYLIVDKPDAVKVKPNQTFLLQSTWKKEGDSVVATGAGTVSIINEKTLELTATINAGKKVEQGDVVLFLVPLVKPVKDTLFFKMARLGISFTSIDDIIFYDRSKLLDDSTAYPTEKILNDMAKDIQRTVNALIELKSPLDQEIKSGNYKGQMMFAVMQKASSDDVLQFMKYVHAKPDKYKARKWRVSETFATWVINGAPKAL